MNNVSPIRSTVRELPEQFARIITTIKYELGTIVRCTTLLIILFAGEPDIIGTLIASIHP